MDEQALRKGGGVVGKRVYNVGGPQRWTGWRTILCPDADRRSAGQHNSGDEPARF